MKFDEIDDMEEYTADKLNDELDELYDEVDDEDDNSYDDDKYWTLDEPLCCQRYVLSKMLIYRECEML